MAVIRDHIPKGEKLNESERKVRRNRNARPGAIRSTARDHKLAKDQKVKVADYDAELERVRKAAAAHAQVRRKVEFDEASKRLAGMTALQAVQLMKRLPHWKLNTYLRAEAKGENRKTVLSAFPKPKK